MKTKFISIAATLLLAASFTSSFAGVEWYGKGAICVNGNWYYADLSQDWCSTPFNNATIGNISSLSFGGQAEVYDPGYNWGSDKYIKMFYKIDDGGFIQLDLYQKAYYDYEGNNNNVFQSGGQTWQPINIDISGLSNGNHTISVYFDLWDGRRLPNAYDQYYVATFTKIPTVTLPNTGNVESTLNDYLEQPARVILNGRTLYSDKWNTLCLPFNLSNFTGTPLAGADVRYLSSSSFVDGSLTLNFQSSNAIQAGIPYIVKLNGNSVENPTFDNVSITTTTASSSPTDFVKFQGCFSSASIEGNQYLYLGANSTLYYPSTSKTIDAFRAYFQLIGITAGDPTSAQGIKAINLNFGDDTNSIQTISNESSSNDGYYTLDGRRLNDKPATAGLYIINGKKVVIK